MPNLSSVPCVKRTVFLKCAHCDYTETRDGDFPAKWFLGRYPERGLYWPCPACGSFLYPPKFELEISADGLLDPFELFSRCPNAATCDAAQNYTPACEQLLLTPRCLLPLYEYIEDIDNRMESIEDELHRRKRNRLRRSAAQQKQ